MKVAVLNFSGRLDGNCSAIAKAVAEFLPDGCEVALEEMHSRNISPCGNCGYECFVPNKECPHVNDGVRELYEAVCSSSAAYYVVPNYCDYPCANFFIFNERGQCYFQHRPDLAERYLGVKKKFIAVSNTGGENFTRAFKYHTAKEIEPEVLVLAAKTFGKASVKGDLLSSGQARETVKEFCGIPFQR